MLITCDYCGVEFNMCPAHIKRGKTHYCCDKHRRLDSRKKLTFNCAWCGVEFQKAPSHVFNDNPCCSQKCRGKFVTATMSGENSPAWRGGKTDDNQLIRASMAYSLWRTSVFERDWFTCRKCGKSGGKLEAHHILAFSRYHNARLKKSNGVTLCKECHKEFHDTYTKTQFTEEDFTEFISV